MGEQPLAVHLTELKRDGFTVFRNHLSSSVVRQLRDVLEPVFQEAFDRDPTIAKLKLGAAPYIAPGRAATGPTAAAVAGGLLRHSLWEAALEPLLHHPWHNSRMLDFCELVMGPCVQLDAFGISGFPAARSGATINQGSKRPPTFVWHRDNFALSQYYPDVQSGGFWGGFEPFYRPPLGINLLCYLQDMSELTGPLRVVPRSHLGTPPTPDEGANLLPHPQEQLLDLHVRSAATAH